MLYTLKKNKLINENVDFSLNWLNAFYADACPICMDKPDYEMKYYANEYILLDSLTIDDQKYYIDNWETEMQHNPDFYFSVIAEYEVTFIDLNKKIKFISQVYHSDVKIDFYNLIFNKDESFELLNDLKVSVLESTFIFEDDLWK